MCAGGPACQDACVTAEHEDGTARRRRWLSPVDLVDVFVYVTVLNLAAEYFPLIIAETSTLPLAIEASEEDFAAVCSRLVALARQRGAGPAAG